MRLTPASSAISTWRRASLTSTAPDFVARSPAPKEAVPRAKQTPSALKRPAVVTLNCHRIQTYRTGEDRQLRRPEKSQTIRQGQRLLLAPLGSFVGRFTGWPRSTQAKPTARAAPATGPTT